MGTVFFEKESSLEKQCVLITCNITDLSARTPAGLTAGILPKRPKILTAVLQPCPEKLLRAAN